MAVVSVWERRTRGGSAASAADASQTRRFFIRVNSLTDNESTIQASGLLPTWLSAHPTNAAATRRGMSINYVKGYIWEAVAEYSTVPLAEQELEKNTNPLPLARRPKISGDFVQVEEQFIKDVNGDAMLNSAGDRFTSPFTRKKSRPTIQVESYHAAIPGFFLNLMDKLNSDAITVKGLAFPAESLIFRPQGFGEQAQEGGQTFTVVKWALEYAPSWTTTRLDEGFFQLSGSDKVPIEIDGERPSEPQLLDGSGAWLENPDPADGVFLEWDTEETASFSGAGMPSLNF